MPTAPHSKSVRSNETSPQTNFQNVVATMEPKSHRSILGDAIGARVANACVTLIWKHYLIVCLAPWWYPNSQSNQFPMFFNSTFNFGLVLAFGLTQVWCLGMHSKFAPRNVFVATSRTTRRHGFANMPIGNQFQRSSFVSGHSEGRLLWHIECGLNLRKYRVQRHAPRAVQEKPQCCFFIYYIQWVISDLPSSKIKCNADVWRRSTIG